MPDSWILANIDLVVGGLIAVAVLTLLLAVYLAIRLRRTERHYANLTRGTDGGNLQDIFEAHAESVRTASMRIEELDCLAKELQRSSRLHLQHIGFLRFNPFRDAGGDQSFALVLADVRGDGVIISSLHSRDSSRVYAKPLGRWTSTYPLTDEERLAIEKAKHPSQGKS